MSIKVEVPQGGLELNEFLRFHDRVYEYRSARWPAALQLQMPILTGEGPYAAGRKVRPFAARKDGGIVARVTAIVDEHYLHHWNEPLGHLVMFEAMPTLVGYIQSGKLRALGVSMPRRLDVLPDVPAIAEFVLGVEVDAAGGRVDQVRAFLVRDEGAVGVCGCGADFPFVLGGVAAQLPQAGAYEFDRYCCNLLRDALDESAVPA